MSDPGRPTEDSGPASEGMHRRGFLRSTAAFAAASAGAMTLSPKTADAQSAGPSATATGGELIIRGGHVLSMDKSIGDLTAGDVHIRNGRIVQVGEHIEAPGAEVMEARDMIVMPGFVDTHSHLWNAFLRGSIRGDDRVRGYFPTTNRAAPLCTSDDAFNSARFGLMEALLSGTTCVNNFSHNTRSVAHAEAEIRASLDVGIRTRFSYGPPGRDQRLDRAGLEEMNKRWRSANPLVRLGVNLDTPAPDVLKSGRDDEDFINDVQFVRNLGLPISFHYGNTAHGLVGLLNRHGLLGPDILMIHTQGFTAEEREAMVAKNVQFSMSPAIEIPYSTVRNGYIQFAELEKLGASLSLSVDASSAMATADFFTVMRALQWSHKQRSDVDRTLEPKRILEIATIGGARALHLDAEIGSLTPGKRADVILIRKNDINIAPVIDPYYSIVYSGSSRNVDTVIVGGELVLRQGKHKALDIAEVAGAAAKAGRDMHDKLERIIASSK
ncbi:amidohydrolase family protein [Microvirga brassicacearum]|uniref:Amidohydrolase family protein n=1 Tax=Microvirga brassicacearum TaxID=2580413 RepID=A0A5N3PDN1_9HYPH|nr:amidohydrolase family protein [Microvirga brassicacearum]KAB0267821.1 amidohydrolase family protein [Microvirga brassicacearum]